MKNSIKHKKRNKNSQKINNKIAYKMVTKIEPQCMKHQNCYQLIPIRVLVKNKNHCQNPEEDCTLPSYFLFVA